MENLIKAVDVNNKTNTSLLLDYLEAVIADEMILNSFIRDIEIIDTTSTKVVIFVKSPVALEQIKNNYLNYFNDAIKNIFQEGLECQFVLSENEIVDNKNDQTIFHKYISEKFKLSNYVEAEFNKEAIKMVKTAIEFPGKYSPIFITSKSGLGKTHILHAVGNEYVKANISCMYIEPNKFTKDVVDYSKIGGDAITKYIDSFKKIDVLLFDDIQNLGDRSVTLKVLFEVINNFIENGKQIIITSDKNPNELSGFESRFITRFSSGLTTTIKEPSLDDLVKVLEFKLKEQNLSPEKWEREALKFIARNNSTSIRSIEGAIKRVSFYIEDESNIKYTYSVVSNIFKELSIDPVELTPIRIINAVAGYYKFTKGDIIGKSRKAEVVIARHMAIWLVRKILDLPLIEIGKIFGNRDHSTIMSSIKTIDKKMLINNIVKLAAEKIEHKIKSVS